MTLNTSRRNVIATSGRDKYLVSLAVTTTAARRSPTTATDAIINGFQVTAPVAAAPSGPSGSGGSGGAPARRDSGAGRGSAQAPVAAPPQAARRRSPARARRRSPAGPRRGSPASARRGSPAGPRRGSPASARRGSHTGIGCSADRRACPGTCGGAWYHYTSGAGGTSGHGAGTGPATHPATHAQPAGSASRAAATTKPAPEPAGNQTALVAIASAAESGEAGRHQWDRGDRERGGVGRSGSPPMGPWRSRARRSPVRSGSPPMGLAAPGARRADRRPDSYCEPMLIAGVLCVCAAVASAGFGTWSLSHAPTADPPRRPCVPWRRPSWRSR